MKAWYINVRIRYVAKDGDDEIRDTEIFSYIIHGSKRNVMKQAKERAKKDIMIGEECIRQMIIGIEDCYETSEDARL